MSERPRTNRRREGGQERANPGPRILGAVFLLGALVLIFYALDGYSEYQRALPAIEEARARVKRVHDSLKADRERTAAERLASLEKIDEMTERHAKVIEKDDPSGAARLRSEAAARRARSADAQQAEMREPVFPELPWVPQNVKYAFTLGTLSGVAGLTFLAMGHRRGLASLRLVTRKGRKLGDSVRGGQRAENPGSAVNLSEGLASSPSSTPEDNTPRP
ncbi:hypothetical protein HY251_03270 [bacterium]|nr:hypothetical protein [bacterium]